MGESPISILPLEVLGEIFLLCCDNSNVFLRPRRSEAPILLCNVSRLWRFTAISTPGLWSSISIKHSDNRLWPSRELIRSWVKRSKGAPLSFELVVENTMHSPSHVTSIQAINEIFLLFLFQFERWKHVRIVVPLAAHLKVECISPEGLSTLESLHIQIDHSPENLLFLPLITDRSPLLQGLIWQLRHFPKPLISDTTLQYLTELYLECKLSPAECLELLTTCTHLHTCELEHVCISSPELRPNISPLEHRNIRILRLEATVDISSLLARLTLPSLLSLSVVISHPGIYPLRLGACWRLSHFFFRSSPPLKSLLLENAPVEEDEIIACLRLLRNLVELNITSSMLSNRIIFALGVSPTQFTCPKLEVIKLCGCLSTDGAFSMMVSARWNAGLASSSVSRLKTVQAEFCNGPHIIDAQRLKRLRAEGLVVRIFTRGGVSLRM